MLPSFLCFSVTLVHGHIFYIYYTLYCFCSRNCVSRSMFVTTIYLMASFVSCLPHWFVSCFTVCLSYLLPTWCRVFKQTPCVYAFCSVIYFRGSCKTMDHSKVSPSCGNITHIWQSLWTMLYQTVILPVWYGIMFLLILDCFTVLFFVWTFVHFFKIVFTCDVDIWCNALAYCDWKTICQLALKSQP
jgi:hypothetical protein